jgi:hypothetical protein
MKIKNKRGNILTENLIFLILNFVFLTILVLFLFIQMGSTVVLEEKYSKQIALIIDSAEPKMTIKLDIGDVIKQAKKENWDFKKIVTITDNIVTVKLREKGGHSYSFFNDVIVNNPYFDKNKLILIIDEK